jgi:hypothetical protein
MRTDRISYHPARGSFAGAGETAKLRIEGVQAPVIATVARRRDDAVILYRDLPFLGPDAEVRDENDRAARFGRVAIDAEREVPRLVLELIYEGPAISGEGAIPDLARRDGTVDYTLPRPERPSGIVPRGVVRDELAAASKRPSSQPPRGRSEESTLVFPTEVDAPRADPSVRTTAPWMEGRASDLALRRRALFARIEVALGHLLEGLRRAYAALRADP